MPKSIAESFKPKVELMERLKRRTDFRAAAAGVRAPARAFVLQARWRGAAGAVRVGFTVSKQVGNAVERNRVRRRLREIVRLAPAAALRAGHDYVLVGRRSALAAPFAEMLRELDAALKRVHSSAGTDNVRPLHEAGSPPRLPRRRDRQRHRQAPHQNRSKSTE